MGTADCGSRPARAMASAVSIISIRPPASSHSYIMTRPIRNVCRTIPCDRSCSPRDGTLWIGSHLGVARRPRGRNELRNAQLSRSTAECPAGVRHSIKHPMARLGRHGLITASISFGRELRNSNFLPMGPSAASATTKLVLDFVEATRGELWIATVDDGVFVVDTASLRIRHLRHDKNVPTSLRDRRHREIF